MFCELETDEKTFEYIKHYIHQWQQHRSFDDMDRTITVQEIEYHIANHPSHLENGHRQAEVLNWIQTNGQTFRAYLNTIKLAFVVYHCSGNDWRDITWEEFCAIRHRLNEVKLTVLDTIMIEKATQTTV